VKIYLDNNATTKICDEVFSTMLPFLKDEYGNPSSSYDLGSSANRAVFKAREQVAESIKAKPQEIIFVSSGTEADNLAIRGAIKLSSKKKHIITSKVEHPAVLNLFKELKSEGYRVSFVGVDSLGNLNMSELERLIDDETALVSIMYANNETGVLFDVEEVGKLARKHHALFHIDAIQAMKKVDIDVNKIKCDLLSISGHKIHAPKGVGALFVKSGLDLSPIFIGGGQERKLRAGTENVAGIVALGKACTLDTNRAEILRLRNKLEDGILNLVPDAILNGNREKRVCNTTNISFPKIEGETLLLLLNKFGIAASMGSACNVGSLEPSKVLLAMGIKSSTAKSSIRFSLSRFSTDEDVDYVLEKIAEIAKRYSNQL
jgi:cysteine desulfurase